MNVWEYLFTAVVVVAALLYLYRVFVVRKGCSCGSSCCSGKISSQHPLQASCQCRQGDKEQR